MNKEECLTTSDTQTVHEPAPSCSTNKETEEVDAQLDDHVDQPDDSCDKEPDKLLSEQVPANEPQVSQDGGSEVDLSKVSYADIDTDSSTEFDERNETVDIKANSNLSTEQSVKHNLEPEGDVDSNTLHTNESTLELSTDARLQESEVNEQTGEKIQNDAVNDETLQCEKHHNEELERKEDNGENVEKPMGEESEHVDKSRESKELPEKAAAKSNTEQDQLPPVLMKEKFKLKIEHPKIYPRIKREISAVGTKPFTVEQLKSLYYNAELEHLDDFVDNFLKVTFVFIKFMSI